MIKKITLSAVAAAAAFTAVPTAASANHYDRGYYDRGYEDRYYGRSERRYYGDRRCSGTTGTIVGGAGGALLGRAIDGGRNRTTGTIAGAAIGALLGRQVGKSSCRSSRYRY